MKSARRWHIHRVAGHVLFHWRTLAKAANWERQETAKLVKRKQSNSQSGKS